MISSIKNPNITLRVNSVKSLNVMPLKENTTVSIYKEKCK
jgi:hypothetical protein